MENYNLLDSVNYPLITNYYNPFRPYKKGEYCLFNGKLFKSRSNNVHSFPRENSLDWLLTSIMAETELSQKQMSDFIDQLIENDKINDISIYNEELTELTNKVNILTEKIEELSYIEIQILSFSSNITKIEKGSVLNSITLNYSINKTPELLTLNNISQTPNSSGNIILSNLNLTSNSTFILQATDEKESISTKTISISFLNKIYYGVAENPEHINDNFLLNLDGKQLSSSKYSPFTVDATENKYIWYAAPSSLGICNFNVGGFDGGFSKISTFSHTNASGYTTNYDVYRSDNHSLGNTTIRVN